MQNNKEEKLINSIYKRLGNYKCDGQMSLFHEDYFKNLHQSNQQQELEDADDYER